MFAVIKTGGKQYMVRPGNKIKVEKLKTPADEKNIIFDNVLLVSDENEANKTLIGTPVLQDYRVHGRILRQEKAEKVIVYKYKSKKRYQKKQGHRQRFSEVEILEISKPK